VSALFTRRTSAFSTVSIGPVPRKTCDSIWSRAVVPGPATEGSLWNECDPPQIQERTDAEIDLTDTDSTTVVGLLDNRPRRNASQPRPRRRPCTKRKTGTWRIINKAADTPYKFFLVLSGLTDQLRTRRSFA